MNTGLFSGEFELAGQGVHGWARGADGSAPLWLELLVDECVMGIVRADLPEPEACGFWLALPPVVLEEGGTLRIRAANTEEYIGKPLHLKEGKSTTALRGELHHDMGLTLSGWVLDTLEPEKKVHVTARLDGDDIAETVACDRRYRPEQGDGHGFTLYLPAKLADGEEHLVTVQDDKERPLPGSPVLVRILPQGVADWLDRQNRLDAPQKNMLSGLIRRMDLRVPHAQSAADYAAWKDVFPVPKISLKQKISINVLVPGDNANVSKCLRMQSGSDFRFVSEGAECALLLQAGERLHPYAVAHLAAVMRETGAGLVYADGEGLDTNGQAVPFFKPCWDRDAFMGRDYLGPMLVSRTVMDALPPLTKEQYAALRVRLALAAEELGGVRHVPLVLSEELPVTDGDTRRAAIQAWLDVRHPGARIEALADSSLSRARYPLAATPRVSIIIPTRDHADLLRRCLYSLLPTAYGNMEIIVVDNDTSEPGALTLLEEISVLSCVRVMRWPGVFNYAAINNFAVREASGELICFLNNDTEILSPDWLTEMVSLLLAAGEQGGCVGAKLLWPNGLVQHGGVIVGTHQLAGHVGNQWLADEPGHINRNLIVQQYSAVTAACLLTPKSLFMELDGFDARRFPVTFNDVDYCLRVRAAGKKVLWTPFAQMLHHESASRGKDVSTMNKARAAREMNFFRSRWGLYNDQFYNPNLPLSTVLEPFDGLALPPRARCFR